MTESSKDKIIADLKQAKQAGQLRAERIREIVKEAVAQAATEIKEGRSEISTLVQEAIATVVEFLKDKGGEIKAEITASVEGAVDGVSIARREAISQTQTEIENLQTKLEAEEQEMQQEIDGVLTDLETKGETESDTVKTALKEAIETVKNSEEAALLQKRYAQLKAQLAVVQANLANRYGERYEDVKKYLDEAKTWYERAKEDPEAFTGKVDQKRTEFEAKLGEAGGAVARKERQIKRLLQDLWVSIREAFQDKDNNTKSG